MRHNSLPFASLVTIAALLLPSLLLAQLPTVGVYFDADATELETTIAGPGTVVGYVAFRELLPPWSTTGVGIANYTFSPSSGITSILSIDPAWETDTNPDPLGYLVDFPECPVPSDGALVVDVIQITVDSLELQTMEFDVDFPNDPSIVACDFYIGTATPAEPLTSLINVRPVRTNSGSWGAVKALYATSSLIPKKEQVRHGNKPEPPPRSLLRTSPGVGH